MDYTTLADETTVNTTMEALKANGIEATLVQNADEAKAKVMELIPTGAEVMENASKTLEELGIDAELHTPGRYELVKEKLKTMDRDTQSQEMNKMGSAPEYAIGSAAAVTQKGEIVWASNTGSQIAGYAYGAGQVVLVVSTKKIVPDTDAAMKRIEEYVVPLENERVKVAYGMDHTNISKILIIRKEVKPGRIHVIFVNEAAGF
jgi:hypothetical protein